FALRDGTGFRGHAERNCNLTAAFSDSGVVCVNNDTWNIDINGTPGATIFYSLDAGGQPLLTNSLVLDSTGSSNLGSPPIASLGNMPIVIRLDSVGLSCCGITAKNDSVIIGRFADPSINISSIIPEGPECESTM